MALERWRCRWPGTCICSPLPDQEEAADGTHRSSVWLHRRADREDRPAHRQRAAVRARSGHCHRHPDTAGAGVLAGVEAVVIAGSMRLTRFQHTLVAFVRAHHEKLSLMPNALVAVSLFGTRQSGIGRWELQRSVERFIEDTGFLPSDVRPIAGALRYSHYGFSGRMAMAVVSKLAGGDLDTSRDCEYTDWKAVTEFAAHFAARALAELHPHPVKLPVEPAIHV